MWPAGYKAFASEVNNGVDVFKWFDIDFFFLRAPEEGVGAFGVGELDYMMSLGEEEGFESGADEAWSSCDEDVKGLGVDFLEVRTEVIFNDFVPVEKEVFGVGFKKGFKEKG